MISLPAISICINSFIFSVFVFVSYLTLYLQGGGVRGGGANFDQLTYNIDMHPLSFSRITGLYTSVENLSSAAVLIAHNR